MLSTSSSFSLTLSFLFKRAEMNGQNPGETIYSLSSNPAVRCSFCGDSCCDGVCYPEEPNEATVEIVDDTKPNTTDPGLYSVIFAIAMFMIIIYGVVMVFFHWNVRVEFVGCINKAIVAAVCIFLGRPDQALYALILLMCTSSVFGFLARRWYIIMEEDDDDSNDSEGDAFFCCYVGSIVELVTYCFGVIMVVGNGIDDMKHHFDGDSMFGTVSAYTIIFATTIYAVWTFKLGVEDELIARKAEKAAVAHILFSEMDADGSGSLDRGEIEALCERLGKKMTPEQIDKAMKEMDTGGEGAVDADEFVHWWINHGGRKVPVPPEMLDMHDHTAARGPPRGNPGHVLEDFRIDDEVRWFKSDESIPKGSIGHVVGFKPNGNVYVAWPNQTYFSMKPGELLMYEPSQTGRSAAEELAFIDDVDALVADPHAGMIVDPDDPEGKNMVPDPRPKAERPKLDFIVGDNVRWNKEEPEVPEGEIGTIVGFGTELQASVQFTSSAKTFQIEQIELELVIAHAVDDAVQAYKVLYLKKVQLVVQQGIEDEEHDETTKNLSKWDEKKIKQWFKKYHPTLKDEVKLDSHQGNGVDDRLETTKEDGTVVLEDKKVWRQRVLSEHANRVAEEWKVEQDAKRAAELAELEPLLERAKVEYEHFTHKTAIGIHDGKIEHAEKVHAKHVAEHEKKLKRLNDKKKFKKKKDLRAEAEAIGANVKGLNKKKIKRKLEAELAAEHEANVAGILETKEKHEKDHAEWKKTHDDHADEHGIEIVAKVQNPLTEGDASLPDEPQDKKGKKGKKGKKENTGRNKKKKGKKDDETVSQNPLHADDPSTKYE